MIESYTFRKVLLMSFPLVALGLLVNPNHSVAQTGSACCIYDGGGNNIGCSDVQLEPEVTCA